LAPEKGRKTPPKEKDKGPTSQKHNSRRRNSCM